MAVPGRKQLVREEKIKSCDSGAQETADQQNHMGGGCEKALGGARGQSRSRDDGQGRSQGVSGRSQEGCCPGAHGHAGSEEGLDGWSPARRSPSVEPSLLPTPARSLLRAQCLHLGTHSSPF